MFLSPNPLAVPPMDDERFERSVSAMMVRGAPRTAAEAELRREINNDYRNLGRCCHIVQPGLITISFGVVTKG